MSGLKDYRLELTDFEQVALEKAVEKAVEKETPKIKKERDFEIAKKLKTFGMELKEISNTTGLTIEEIENL